MLNVKFVTWLFSFDSITVFYLRITAVEDARALLGLSRVTDEEEVAFPDTVVPMSISSSGNQKIVKTLNEEESYTIIGDVPTVSKNQWDGKGKDESGKSNQPTKKIIDTGDQEKDEEPKTQQPVTKRGHKGKMKKIKEKYKDQDEEERQLKIELLQVIKNSSALLVNNW